MSQYSSNQIHFKTNICYSQMAKMDFWPPRRSTIQEIQFREVTCNIYLLLTRGSLLPQFPSHLRVPFSETKLGTSPPLWGPSKCWSAGRTGSPAWWEATWPSACMPLLPRQICVGPYHPCSARCRRGWWHLHISATACKDSWPPKWFLRKDVRCRDGFLTATHFSKFFWNPSPAPY